MEQVLFSNKVKLDDDRVMKLEYGLVENISDQEQKSPYYGILVTKQLEGMVEKERIDGVSESRVFVVTMLQKLCQYEVTPISTVVIVDQLITEGV